MPNVQSQDGLGEQLPQLLRQAPFAVHDDLDRLGRVGGETTPAGLLPCPLQGDLPATERAVDLLVARAVQSVLLTPFEGVHGDQDSATAVLALVPWFAFLLLATTLAATAATVPLTPTRALFGLAGRAALVQLLFGGGGNGLAVALQDQHLAIPFRQRRSAEVGMGGPPQPQDPLLDRGGGRRPAQEHTAQFGGQTVAQAGAEPTEPTDQKGSEAVACQPQESIQGMPAWPRATPGDQVDPTVQELAVGGVEGARGVVVGHPVTPLGVAGSQVEALMADQQKQLQQQQSQRGQLRQQGLLEVEEGGLEIIVLARVAQLIQTLVQLPPQILACGWTRRRRVVRLSKAHGVDSWLVPWDAKQQPG